MSDNQIFMSPVRGAVAQQTGFHAVRNAAAAMRAQSLYGPESLRRWGPRAFGDTQAVGGALRGLGEVYDALDARAQGLDAASNTVTDNSGTVYYLDAGGTVLAATDAAGTTTYAPIPVSGGDFSKVALILIGMAVLMEFA